MLTLKKGPSKIVAKTRRGISQSYDQQFRDLKNVDQELSSPRPVFQTSRKFSSHLKSQHNSFYNQEDLQISPQHQEIVKYINESWNMVMADNPYDAPSSPDSAISMSLSSKASISTLSDASSSLSSSSSSSISGAPIYYQGAPSPVLTEFKPFDLEAWWGRRLYNSITKSL